MWLLNDTISPDDSALEESVSAGVLRYEGEAIAFHFGTSVFPTHRSSQGIESNDHRVAGIGRARLGESLQERRRGGRRQGGELQKPSACDVSPHGERAADGSFYSPSDEPGPSLIFFVSLKHIAKTDVVQAFRPARHGGP